MNNFKKYVNETKSIEKVLLECYGTNGRSGLIQARQEEIYSSENSFILTNDGMTILNSFNFYENHLLILLTKLVRKHSARLGDGCKTIFIYISTFMTMLLNSNDQKTQELAKQFIVLLRQANLTNDILQPFLSEFNNQHQVVKIKTKHDFLEYLDRMCVLNDLENLNRNLCQVSHTFIRVLIRNYLDKGEVISALRELMDDLDLILVYSNKKSLNDSKLFENGFLLESRITLNNFDVRKDEMIKAICLFIDDHDSNQIMEAKINIEKCSDLAEKVQDLLYVEKSSFLSDTFIQQLKQKNISLIITNRSLNGFQKSQLNLQNISLVEYADKDLLNKICHKLKINTIELIRNDLEEIDLIKHVIYLDEIIKIETDQIILFKLNNQMHPSNLITSIYFCSPIKVLFVHFKSNLIKSAKSLIDIFEKNNYCASYLSNQYYYLIEGGSFEKMSIQICQKLENEYLGDKSNKHLFFRILKILFQDLDAKLNQSNEISSHLSSLTLNTNDTVNYESLNLKIECLFQCLDFVKTIIKIDQIVYVKKEALSSLKKRTESSSDDAT